MALWFFQMQRVSEVARAAVVVEGRYSALFSFEHVPAAFIADGLARLQVRYPSIPVVSQTRGSSLRNGLIGSSQQRFGCRVRRSSC
jgi:hypothetical protein